MTVQDVQNFFDSLFGTNGDRIALGSKIVSPIVTTVESRFLEPQFFKPPDNSNQKSFPSPQSNTVILPPISRTLRVFEPIFVSLRGSKNRDFTLCLYQSCMNLRSWSRGQFVLHKKHVYSAGMLWVENSNVSMRNQERSQCRKGKL